MDEQKKEMIEKKKKKLKTNLTNKNRYLISFNFFAKISIVLFIISYYLYYLSLEKCYAGFDVCADRTTWI